MKERPILFSAPMVRALLDGSKTQTRRIAKPRSKTRPSLLDGGWSDSYVLDEGNRDWLMQDNPYGQPGDRLWVRETWMPDAPRDGTWADVAFFGCKNASLSLIPERYQKPEHCLFRSTWDRHDLVGWKPSIHMPRWASRITLEVTGVRVERLNDISWDDALAEGLDTVCDGCTPYGVKGIARTWNRDPRKSYAELWETINGAGSWAANSWVWVVEFKRMTGRDILVEVRE